MVFEKTVEVHRTLKTLVSDPSISADTRARIKVILKYQLSSLHILFNLNVARKLIVLLEKFSKELQAVDISANYALNSVQHILQRLHEMRDNKEFQRILDEAKSISGIEEASTDGARKRKVPGWMESGDSMLTEMLHTTRTVHGGSIGDMRQSYFEAIVIFESINRRFEQEDLNLIKTIEQILLRSMIERGYPIDTLERALINKDKLRVQLDDLPTILGLYNVDRRKKMTSISRVSTIAEIFNSISAVKKQCSEVHKLVKLYYTIPLTSESCERTFSAMRRLKTWLRVNTEANHLNSIMFANIQKKDLDKVDIKSVAR